jgi:hypothetical protein
MTVNLAADTYLDCGSTLRTELPVLREQQRHGKKELEGVESQTDVLINEWAALSTGDEAAFLREKLDDLGKRRAQIEEGLAALEIAISEVEMDGVDWSLVTQALADFTGVFAELKPYQQKELMRLVLHKAILGPDYLKIGLYGRRPELGPLSKGEPRSQTFDWLPGQMSQSVVLWDICVIAVKRDVRGKMRIALFTS